jgi:hypothetical protein
VHAPPDRRNRKRKPHAGAWRRDDLDRLRASVGQPRDAHGDDGRRRELFRLVPSDRRPGPVARPVPLGGGQRVSAGRLRRLHARARAVKKGRRRAGTRRRHETYREISPSTSRDRQPAKPSLPWRSGC